ncbi:MAG: TRAP transporter substrate-binding protein DctP [Pseudomonadota bacterium]
MKITTLSVGAAALIAAGFSATTAQAGSHAVAKVEGPAVNWRFSTWGKPRAFTVGVEHLAKRVAELTDGKFKIKIFYGGTLSKSRENLDGLKINAFDAAHFCNFYHPGKNPAFMVFTMPFLPLGDFAVSAYARNKLYEHPALVKDMDRWNAIAYASTLLPQYEFLGRGKVPATVADFKGLRVRAGGGIGKAMEKVGAVRQTMPATEVYTAIQRGTADAVSFPFTYAHGAYKIHEVANWYTTNLTPGTSECPIVLNKTSFNKLPAQYQKLLMDLKMEVAKAYVDAYKKADAKYLPLFKAKLKPVTFTDAELAKFKEVAGKPVWDAWVKANASKFDAQNVLDTLLKLANEAKTRGSGATMKKGGSGTAQ